MKTSSTGNATRLELRNDVSELGPLAEAVESLCANVEIGALSAIRLALEEIVTNVIDYAHPEGGDHPILVDVTLEHGVFTARIEDDGIAYNPLAHPAPRLDIPIEKRPIGGLGVHLVKSLMDDVTYLRQRDRNVLTIRKHTLPGEDIASEV